jgi:hypothetical protein
MKTIKITAEMADFVDIVETLDGAVTFGEQVIGRNRYPLVTVQFDEEPVSYAAPTYSAAIARVRPWVEKYARAWNLR